MNLIPVVNMKSDEITNICRDDIVKVGSGKRGLIFTTTDGAEYRIARTQEEIEEAWAAAGFMQLDSTNVVNLNMARVYDRERGVVLFDDKDTYATVARINQANFLSVTAAYGIDVKEPPEKEQPQKFKGTLAYMR